MAESINIIIHEDISRNYSNINEMIDSLQEDIIIGEFQKGKISIREGAKILGITYREFLQWLGERNISIINTNPEELQESYKSFNEKMKKDESNL